MRPSSRLPLALAGACVVLTLCGCVKKPPLQPEATYIPEGTVSPDARLIAFPDLPSTLLLYLDRVPLGPVTNVRGVKSPGPEDSLIGTTLNYRRGAGANNLMLLDGTTADAFEMYRRENNGGFYNFRDFIILPTRKWLDGHLEVYMYTDLAPSTFTPSTYLLRGRVGGTFTDQSPLTNIGVVSGMMPAEINLTSALFPTDSLFDIEWDAVPGATGYWVQVYQYLEAQTADKIASGVPAPVYVEKSRDFFLAYVPAPNTSTSLKNHGSATVFAQRVTLRAQIYFVRVTAIDANGALVGFTYGEYDAELGAGEYTLYPLGATAVGVQAPSPVPSAVSPPVFDPVPPLAESEDRWPSQHR